MKQKNVACVGKNKIQWLYKICRTYLYTSHLPFDCIPSLVSWHVCARPAQVGVCQCKFTSYLIPSDSFLN